MPNGDGSGFDFGGIFDPLLGELGAVVAAILQFLNDLVGALVRVFNEVFSNEVAIANFALGGFTETWKGLKEIVEDILHGHFLLALKHLRDLLSKLQEWAKKLKKWLDKLQRIQKQLQGKAFRDVINLIQRVRKILLVFRLLHLKFATKLDNWLARIEGKLIQRQLEYSRKTNEIIGWLDLILDPKHGLSHLPIFLAAGKSADAFLVIFTGHGIDYWYSRKPPAGYGVGPSISVKMHYDALDAQLATNSGDVAAWRDNFAQMTTLMQEIR